MPYNHLFSHGWMGMGCYKIGGLRPAPPGAIYQHLKPLWSQHAGEFTMEYGIYWDGWWMLMDLWFFLGESEFEVPWEFYLESTGMFGFSNGVLDATRRVLVDDGTGSTPADVGHVFGVSGYLTDIRQRMTDSSSCAMSKIGWRERQVPSGKHTHSYWKWP